VDAEEIKQRLRTRARTTFDGVGLPPVDCICILDSREYCCDVRIVAHTFVAGRVAAVWQFGDEFGYGRPGDFSIDPDQ
jgi:hypothetical protein